MIKIVSGFSIPIGSTVALVNLCNQFNERGYDCLFYGPDKWHLDKCKSADVSDFYPETGDTVIIHHIKLFSVGELYRLPEKIEQLHQKRKLDVLKGMIRRHLPGGGNHLGIKLILTSQANVLFPLKRINYALFDKIHFADPSQAVYHRITSNYFVCPNFSSRLTIPAGRKPDRVAGVIGSIRRESYTAQSIERAFADGMETVILYGYLVDPVYYYSAIAPLTKKYPGKIRYAGFVDDRQKLYDSISDVYRTGSRPWSSVETECRRTNTRFHGTGRHTEESMTDNQIFAIWKDQLGL